MVLSEFVPSDQVRRARDRLRRLKKNTSVSKYLSELRNFILTIKDILEGDMLDRVVQ